MKMCDYGCGREAKYQMTSGKWCCEEKYQRCPAIIDKTTVYLYGEQNGMYGKHHSEMWKINNSNIMKGNQYRKGIPHSDEIKLQISTSLKKVWNDPDSYFNSEEWKPLKGVDAPNWTGGCTGYWSQYTKQRHNYTCYLCGSKYRVECHHLDNNRDNNEHYNLRCICNDCHEFWHHSY